MCLGVTLVDISAVETIAGEPVVARTVVSADQTDTGSVDVTIIDSPGRINHPGGCIGSDSIPTLVGIGTLEPISVVAILTSAIVAEVSVGTIGNDVTDENSKVGHSRSYAQ